MQAPIKASLEVQQVGVGEMGNEVYVSVEALKADGIVIINRVKPHTDFSGTIGSGIMKMLVIGLGKRVGAASFHGAASRYGYEKLILGCARIILRSAPIMCGVALVENQRHETAKLAVIRSEDLERREPEIFLEAKALMPKLPFDEIDLLVIDRIGKNISGAGMDPNIVGRGAYGSSSSPGEKRGNGISIRRIFVRDLTPESHGNACGIGFADFTTTRLAEGMDKRVSYINALTAVAPHSVKLPIHFDTDREVLTHALTSLAARDTSQAKVVRIADTLSLERVEVAEAFVGSIPQNQLLETLSQPAAMQFDSAGNLAPLAV